MSAEEIVGLECDWLGCDADGHVALFSTAGGGYAPDGFLRDPDAHAAALEMILEQRPSTTARFAPELKPGSTNIWRLVAERGLFAFDADIDGGPYESVAAPVDPVHVDQLPPGVVDVLIRLRTASLRFADSRTVTGGALEAGIVESG